LNSGVVVGWFVGRNIWRNIWRSREERRHAHFCISRTDASRRTLDIFITKISYLPFRKAPQSQTKNFIIPVTLTSSIDRIAGIEIDGISILATNEIFHALEGCTITIFVHGLATLEDVLSLIRIPDIVAAFPIFAFTNPILADNPVVNLLSMGAVDVREALSGDSIHSVISVKRFGVKDRYF
jgi:hypothetical protein